MGVLYASPFKSLYPLQLSLSYLSLPLYISPSTFLSLFSLSFSLVYLITNYILPPTIPPSVVPIAPHLVIALPTCVSKVVALNPFA